MTRFVHRRLRDRNTESGQAMVEFALILLPLLVFVGGVIHLGIGVAGWHDLNRIANEGARYAATDEWPGCPASASSCTGNPACNAAPAALVGRTLTNFIRCEAVDSGLPSSVTVDICTPGAAAVTGEPVTVRLSSRIGFLSLDATDRNRVGWLTTTIRGEATMRIERTSRRFTPPAC